MEGSCAHEKYKAAVRIVRKGPRVLQCSPLQPTLLYIPRQVQQAIDDHNLHTLRISNVQSIDLGASVTLRHSHCSFALPWNPLKQWPPPNPEL